MTLEDAARAALDTAWGYAAATCMEFCVHGGGDDPNCPLYDPTLKALEAALAALDATRKEVAQ